MNGSPRPPKNASFRTIHSSLTGAPGSKSSHGRRPKASSSKHSFPVGRVSGEFYEEATRGRSASHHLQVKAALALLYHVLGSPNPFAQCLAPKFAPEKTELRYHTSSQLGQLLRELREDRGSYFGHLTYHLATALFFTGCRYHEWALLTVDRLVREPGGVIIAARLQVTGPRFAICREPKPLCVYLYDR